MRTIIDKLRDSISPIIGGEDRFHYADRDDLNVILDNACFPCAFCNLAKASVVDSDYGGMREKITIEVYFCDLVPFGIDGIENERVLQLQKERALEWVALLKRSDDFLFGGVNGTNRWYSPDGLDVNFTAYSVSVTLTEVKSYGDCGI